MKQDYRLLVLDLDGTLTNSKKEISPRNLRTLLRLQQSGVRLVLASGRPTYGIVPLAEQLQMKENNVVTSETKDALSFGALSHTAVSSSHPCDRASCRWSPSAHLSPV